MDGAYFSFVQSNNSFFSLLFKRSEMHGIFTYTNFRYTNCRRTRGWMIEIDILWLGGIGGGGGIG